MKIVVAYDQSDAVKSAVELAKKHAKAFDAQVFLITSLAQGPELRREDIQKVERQLEKVKMSFKDAGISCKTYANVSFLSPGEELVQFAKENEIDEIIIGIKKKSKVGKLLFGSNAQYIILQAPCTVVTVK